MLALGDWLLLALADGETLGEGLIEGEMELLGLWLALTDGDSDDDPSLGLALSLELGDMEAEAELDGL